VDGVLNPSLARDIIEAGYSRQMRNLKTQVIIGTTAGWMSP
jgi:hypothetical protein